MRLKLSQARYALPPVAAAVVSLAVTGLAGSRFQVRASTGPAPASPEFYTLKVQPIFQANCFRCHAGMNHRGGLSMDTRAGLMTGGHDGVVIVPGHPEQSLLVKLIRHEGPTNDPMPMPPKGKLSDADIATVEQWIQGGANMPPNPAVQ